MYLHLGKDVMSTGEAPYGNPTLKSSQLKRLFGVFDIFTSPARAFAHLRQQPSIWIPWIILCICSVSSTFLMLHRVDVKVYARGEILKTKSAEFFEQLPPATQQQKLELAATIIRVYLYVSPVLMFIAAMIVSVVLMASFNLLFKAEISTRNSVAIVSNSLLPLALSYVFVIVLVLLKANPYDIDIRHPLMLSLAAFLDPMGDRFIYEVGKSFDLFSIWIMCLLGLGFQAIAARRSFSRTVSIGLIFGIYLLWVVCRSAAVAMLS